MKERPATVEPERESLERTVTSIVLRDRNPPRKDERDKYTDVIITTPKKKSLKIITQAEVDRIYTFKIAFFTSGVISSFNLS